MPNEGVSRSWSNPTPNLCLQVITPGLSNRLNTANHSKSHFLVIHHYLTYFCNDWLYRFCIETIFTIYIWSPLSYDLIVSTLLNRYENTNTSSSSHGLHQGFTCTSDPEKMMRNIVTGCLKPLVVINIHSLSQLPLWLLVNMNPLWGLPLYANFAK